MHHKKIKELFGLKPQVFRNTELVYNNELAKFVEGMGYKAVLAERALLKTLEGGCQVPIGAFAEVKQNALHIEALVGSLDGSITYRKKIRGSKNNPEKLGKKLADDLLKAGAKIILEEIYKTARSK